MIGAICFKINEIYRAKLYLSGSYNYINWEAGYSTDLGDSYVAYNFKTDSGQQPAMYVAQGLDGNYILRLVETKRYILKLECEEESVELPHFQNEGNKFLKCDKDKDSITFQFINYLGRSRALFLNDDVELVFEVIPDKMNYEDDYVQLTEALANACAELLLEYSGSTSNVFSQSNESRNTLLEQFIFLRKFCYGDNLQGLFESIKRNPDRTLDQEDELKPIGTGKPSKNFYRNPFSFSRGWRKISDDSQREDTFAPQMVAVTHKFDRLDTPANRFIKFALQKFDYVCSELINALEVSDSNLQIECLHEAKAIHGQLDYIFRDRFFDEIGDLDVMPQNNQVLLKREGYSQIFAAYSMLDLALQLDWKGENDIYEGESKNVALLYEYWLFFELFKIIKSIEGCRTVITGEDTFLYVDDGLTVSLEEGKKSCQSFEIDSYGVKINLYYNRTFSKMEFRTTQYEGSYSRPFRPDYTLAIFPNSYNHGTHNGEDEAIRYGAVSYVHFDAKYRVSDLTSLIGTNIAIEAETDFADDEIDAVVNTYKRGDLLKMHTYNDAIRRTIGSYVLYPGSSGINNTGNETFSLYDEILPGVGAFSIKPSIEDLGEKALRAFIMSLVEERGSKNSRLNRLKYYTEMILGEPSIIKSKSSIVLNGNVELRKGERYVLGYIRNESEKDYYSFLKKNGLLSKGGEFIFYFYAIKDNEVYSHHKDIFRISHLRLYSNRLSETNTYEIEPVVCRIMSNELISKENLAKDLCKLGYNTNADDHYADFYYVLRVKVEADDYPKEEFSIDEVNRQEGNDTFSPHSPKVMIF